MTLFRTHSSVQVYSKLLLTTSETFIGYVSMSYKTQMSDCSIKHIKATIQDGPEELIMNRSRGGKVANAVLRAADGVLLEIPNHPDPLHVGAQGEPRAILPRVLADMVLTPVHPGTLLREGDVLACECDFGDQIAVPLRVVWFVPSSADNLRGLATGTTEAQFAVVADWSLRSGSDGDRKGSTQPANGLGYIELGTGGMTGRGRPHVQVAGQSLTVPFSRNGSLSDDIEPTLSGLHAAASCMLEACYPGLWNSQHKDRELSVVEQAWQYPAAVPGCPCLPTHQAVPRLGGGLSV